MKHVALILGSLVLSALASAPALADTYTYTYTGNLFANATSGTQGIAPTYNTSDFVSGSIVLSELLGPNLGNTTGQVQAESGIFEDASFSDGLQTLDTNSGASSHIILFTDANGTITGWNIEIYNATSEINVFNVPNYPGNGDAGSMIVNGVYQVGYNNDPGTWTMTDNPSPTATPEPSSLLLLGTSLLGSAAILRRRLAL